MTCEKTPDRGGLEMKEETPVYQRLKEEGADFAMLEQYRRCQETGNIRGQYGLVCRFRRTKKEALETKREKLACLDYLIAKMEKISKREREGE